MSNDDMVEKLRCLSGDERFPAMVKFMSDAEKSWADAVAMQQLAHEHGKLAHAAGSLHSVQRLRTYLSSILRGRNETEGMSPPD